MNPKEILRLHNVCFQHFVLLKNMIKFEKLKMPRDKIYGKYLHNLLVHAPLQYRLVSGESINCEDEERFFKTICDITHGTLKNSQGHLIGNLIVRLEVESRCRERYEFNSGEDSSMNEIYNLSLSIHAKESNSLFSYEFIQQN